ncbi:RNA polymerase sigma factor [Echinicola sp. 20G]|uniref:RNA polymerase sigma factor n=1 Tax=Echinicola sp. 20G TaxID=2781961 RepID=UPI00191030B3|nr:sigma-70 family RNA polymerase sigma factor [Echinicola sp. 20G]
MNSNIYDYVESVCKTIKNKEDFEDVRQEVLLILCEKELIDKPLTDRLKNYIKGIVWNYSTTFYKQFHYGINYLSEEEREIPDFVPDEVYYIEDTPLFKSTLNEIKQYVFKNYYLIDKKLTRWRVFYLVIKGYSYKEIAKRLSVTYQTAIEYNYKCMKEIKSKLQLECVGCRS